MECQGSVGDRRVREGTITSKGKAMTDLVDDAHERVGRRVFARWSERDINESVRLMRRFANDITEEVPGGPPGDQ